MTDADRCLAADAALSLVQLLGPDPHALDHIVRCPTCRSRIDAWQAVGEALEETPPREGFANQVLEALPATRRARSWLWVSLNGLLSFVAAGLTLAWLRAAPSPSVVLAASLLAALLGLAVSAPRVASDPV